MLVCAETSDPVLSAGCLRGSWGFWRGTYTCAHNYLLFGGHSASFEALKEFGGA